MTPLSIPNPGYGDPKSHPVCLYCGSTAFHLLYASLRDRLGHVPGEHTLWQCQHCGSALLVPMPKESDLGAFYPAVYSFTLETQQQSWLKKVLAAAEYQLFFKPQYLGQALQVLQQIGSRPAGQRKLLDIGCGRGLRLLEFRRRGWEVAGADLQADVVRYLNDELRIPAKTAGFSEVGQLFPPASFDLVTSYLTFEHIPDVEEGFRICWGLLKPGGWVAVLVPLVDSAQHRLFGPRWVNITEVPRHLSLPSQRGIEGVARRVGFTQVRTCHDHPLGIAGAFALSAVPAGNSTQVYGQGGLKPLLYRVAGACATVVGLGLACWDRWTKAIPAHGLILGQKPVNNS